MNAPSSPSRARRIQRALRSSWAKRLAPRIRRMADAVWNVPAEEPAAHSFCETELPGYVALEIDDEREIIKASSVRRHLLACPSCATRYVDLLEMALLDRQGDLPRAPIPPPDLSFLEI